MSDAKFDAIQKRNKKSIALDTVFGTLMALGMLLSAASLF